MVLLSRILSLQFTVQYAMLQPDGRKQLSDPRETSHFEYHPMRAMYFFYEPLDIGRELYTYHTHTL